MRHVGKRTYILIEETQLGFKNGVVQFLTDIYHLN